MTPEERIAEAERVYRKTLAAARKEMAERDRKAIERHNERTAHLHNLQYQSWGEMSPAQRNFLRAEVGIEFREAE